MGCSDSMGNDVPREKALCSSGLGDKEHPDVHQATGWTSIVHWNGSFII